MRIYESMRIYEWATNKEKGFTLIELLVSVSIFAVVVTLGLAIFNQVLQIQRRSEVTRRLTQAVRNTSEFLVKEIRNGKIDYGIQNGATLKNPYLSHCPQPLSVNGSATYVWNNANYNQAIAIDNDAGETECVYYVVAQKALYLEKLGLTTPQRLTPGDVSIDRFEVRLVPGRDPYMDVPPGSLAETQPLAQILMVATAALPGGGGKTINYQTAVSTNDYDIPKE